MMFSNPLIANTMTIHSIPRGSVETEQKTYLNDCAMLHISPASNAAYTEMAATTTAATHTLTGQEMVKITATDYPVRFRFLTATDTDAVTAANARDYVSASGAEYYAVPSGATGISVMTVGGDATVVIVEF